MLSSFPAFLYLSAETANVWNVVFLGYYTSYLAMGEVKMKFQL